MIESNPQRKKSFIFDTRINDEVRPLDDLLAKMNSGRQQQETDQHPPQNRSRVNSISRLPSLVPHRFGSIANLHRQPSGIIKPPSYEDHKEEVKRPSTQSSRMKHNMAKYLNEYDDGSDTDSSSEQEHKTGAWGNLKSLVVPRRKGKKNSQLITPLDIVKDDVVRKAQYSGKEYRIKARPRSYLLSIIAIQAVAGPYPQISKIFADALNKVNPDMLVWARYVQQKRKKSKILRMWQTLKTKILRPLSPESSIILYMDILLFFTILTQTFFCTYLVTFVPNGDATNDNPFIIVCYISDFIYFIKILMTFHTGYYYLGEINYRHKDIALNYLRHTFIIDAISMLDIIGYFFINSNWKALQCLAVLRLYRIPGTIQMFEDYFLVSREFSYVIRVLKLAMVIFLYGHFLGCALYALAYRNRDDPNNWFTSNGFEGQSSGDAYATSLYFALETASTLGFGEITPGTTGERIFFVPQMIASAILFGYVISVIARILAEMSMFSFEARERIRLLKKYMRDKGVQKSTQTKIIKYARFFLSRENLAKVKDNGMVQFLSEGLRDDLIREVNVKILNQCQMFTYNFRTKFLLAVSKALVERAFGPDEIIFRYRDREDLSVYFLISGKVEAYYARLGLSLGVLEKQGAFGFVSFFDGKSRPNDQRSLEFTTVFQLKRETFMEKLREFPSERETYYLIKDSMVMYKEYKHLVNVHCVLCGEKNHIALVCPLYHWYPDKEKVVQKHLNRRKHFARSFRRKDRPRISSLGRLTGIQNAALRIQTVETSELVTHYRQRIRDEEEFFSFSPMNELFDRNIFRLPSFTFQSESNQPKRLTINENAGVNSADAVNILDCIEAKPRMGEIERFVIKSYDGYYRNLNIDRVRNYEMYFPHNNILMISAEWERKRLSNVAKMHNVSEKVLQGLNTVFEKHKRSKKGRRESGSSAMNRSISHAPQPLLDEIEEVPSVTKAKSVNLSSNQPAIVGGGATISKFAPLPVVKSQENSYQDVSESFIKSQIAPSKSPRKSIFNSAKSLTQAPYLPPRQLFKHASSLPKHSDQPDGAQPGDSVIDIAEDRDRDQAVDNEDSVNHERRVPLVDNYQQSRLTHQTQGGESQRSSVPLRMRRRVDNSLLIRTGKGYEDSSVESKDELLEGERSEVGGDTDDEIEDMKLAMRSEFEGLMDKMTKTLLETKRKGKGKKSKKDKGLERGLQIPEMRIERDTMGRARADPDEEEGGEMQRMKEYNNLREELERHLGSDKK